MQTLPKDVLTYLVVFIDDESLISVGLVNTEFNAIVNQLPTPLTTTTRVLKKYGREYYLNCRLHSAADIEFDSRERLAHIYMNPCLRELSYATWQIINIRYLVDIMARDRLEELVNFINGSGSLHPTAMLAYLVFVGGYYANCPVKFDYYSFGSGFVLGMLKMRAQTDPDVLKKATDLVDRGIRWGETEKFYAWERKHPELLRSVKTIGRIFARHPDASIEYYFAHVMNFATVRGDIAFVRELYATFSGAEQADIRNRFHRVYFYGHVDHTSLTDIVINPLDLSFAENTIIESGNQCLMRGMLSDLVLSLEFAADNLFTEHADIFEKK